MLAKKKLSYQQLFRSCICNTNHFSSHAQITKITKIPKFLYLCKWIVKVSDIHSTQPGTSHWECHCGNLGELSEGNVCFAECKNDRQMCVINTEGGNTEMFFSVLFIIYQETTNKGGIQKIKMEI